MNLDSIMKLLYVFFSQHLWLVKIAVCIIFILLFNFSINFIYNRFMPKLAKTNKVWDDSLLISIYKPVKILVWLLGLIYAFKIIIPYKSFFSEQSIGAAQALSVLFITIWCLMRFTKQIEARLIEKSSLIKTIDKTTVSAISKLICMIIIILGALTFLQLLGISISVVLAFGGGGAIVIGLAAKDLLANFFGGLMVYLDRSFSVGDWIASPDKEIEGTVEHIGWRSTRIRTFKKRLLYIPNSLFLTLAIENPSRMTNRRIKTVFGVRYCDAPKIAKIVTDIENMLKNHPEIDTRQTLFVKLIEFGASSLDILIYTFTKTTQWVKFQSIQEEIFLEIIDIVYNKHGASMAFPTRTLEMEDSITVNLQNLKRGIGMIDLNDIRNMQENATLLYSPQEINSTIDRMAQQLTETVGTKNPVLLCVMTGALTFMGQLLPKLNFLLQTDYIHTTRYGGNMEGGKLQWVVEPSISLKDRTVVIIEDILDAGVTLAAIKDYCEKQEAKEIYTAVLVDKDNTRDENGVQHADFTGLHIENKFLIGYGLDYQGFFRNLNGIYAVE